MSPRLAAFDPFSCQTHFSVTPLSWGSPPARAAVCLSPQGLAVDAPHLHSSRTHCRGLLAPDEPTAPVPRLEAPCSRPIAMLHAPPAWRCQLPIKAVQPRCSGPSLTRQSPLSVTSVEERLDEGRCPVLVPAALVMRRGAVGGVGRGREGGAGTQRRGGGRAAGHMGRVGRGAGGGGAAGP